MNLKKKMRDFFTLSRESNGGFTLVELIVVIAILAILAGVAVPVYSGYVKKANKAADEQLLATVNTAFAAACAENGTDVYSLDVIPTIVLEGDAGAKTVGDVSLYDDAFDKYFAGNEGSVFKVFKGLSFNQTLGMFQPISDAFANLVGIFSGADISSFNGSIFATLGIDSLMRQVDMATQVALAADEDSTLGQMIFSDANNASLAGYLGYDLTDPDEAAEFDAAFMAMAQEKAEQMIAAGADPSDDTLLYQAAKEIYANTAVLVAATKTTFDTNTFRAQLAAGNGKSTIQTSMNTDEGEQVALSQTAMAYAMYTSYVSRNGGTATNDILEVLDTLETNEFKTYMNSTEATTDLNGYLSAMNMIEDASGDKEAVSSLLVNGFTNPDLIALLTQEISG